MKAKGLTSQFPSKSFTEVFDERSKLISVQPDQIDRKKSQYKKIFYFDSLIEQAKGLLKENHDLELSDHEEERFRFFIDKIRDPIKWIDRLDFSQPTDINNIFKKFHASLSDSKWMEPIQHQIGGRSVSSGLMIMDEYINELSNLINIVTIKTLRAEELKDIKESANQLIKNKDVLTKAIEKAENWMRSEEKAMEVALKKRSASFYQKSAEHKGWKVWLWLIAAILSGLIIGFIVEGFIDILTVKDALGKEMPAEITLGAALLRLSALIVPSYFAIFFTQRFLTHRKLYEAYRFRDISIETMNILIKLYTSERDNAHRFQILEKGLNIIFSEPSIKEAENSLAIISELKDILKNKVSE